MNFRKIFNENLDTLYDLLRINSIYDENTVSKQAPCGKGVKQAVDFMKQLAEKDGFIVKEYDNQVLTISNIALENQRIDIASHLDVVQVDDGWDFNPFEPFIKGGKLYGRGTSDMKVALFLTYLSLKLLKEKYPQTTNEIRLVLGTDEERTMNDMRYYCSKVSEPLFAFSPDGSFPMVIGEKGALMWSIKDKYDGIIESLDGGIQCNIVPDYCEIVLKNNLHTKDIENYFKKNRINGSVSEENQKTKLTVKGKAIHCALCYWGKNAITIALKAISPYDETAKNLANVLGPNFGQGFGLKRYQTRQESLTVNLGVLKIENGNITGQIDARYPVDETSASLTNKLKKHLKINISLDYDDEPTYTPQSDIYVKEMLKVYRQNTLDFTRPLILGGVSYSKVFKHCITFGLRMPLEWSMAHQRNEYVKLKYVYKAFRIYYKAIEKLAFIKKEHV